MDSYELAGAVNRTVAACQERILGVGQDQYDLGDTQQFEEMSILELLGEAQDEALDLINYGVMAHIRFARLSEALKRMAADEVQGAAEGDLFGDGDDWSFDRAGEDGTCGDRDCSLCYT